MATDSATDTNTTTPRAIHIVGAGIGGLTAALALDRAGHRVALSERAPGPSEIGAGITLWPNALRVLDHLGVGQRIRAAGAPLTSAVLGTNRGRILSRTDTPPDHSPLGVHRATLQQLLVEAASSLPIDFDRHCVAVDDDGLAATVSYRAGPSVRCDLVVGADGIHSAVRAAVLGPEPPRYGGYTSFRGVVDGWDGPPPVAGEFWGAGRRFGIVPLGHDQLYWFATSTQPEGERATDRHQLVQELFAGWAFDIPDLLAATRPERVLQHDVFDRAPTTGWYRGRVVLVGDAIHPTTPNLGQGAAMAIEDGPVLARALDREPEPAQAFEVFERTRRQRTTSVTTLSRRIGGIGQLDGRLRCALRNTVARLTPTAVATRQTRRLGQYDAITTSLASPPATAIPAAAGTRASNPNPERTPT